MEFKKSQLWITLPSLNTPGGCAVFLQGKEAEKETGMTSLLPKRLHLPSGSDSFCGECVCRPQWVQSLPLAQPDSRSSLTHFVFLFFSSAGQSPIFHSRPHKVCCFFTVLCLRSARPLLLGRSSIKLCI